MTTGADGTPAGAAGTYAYDLRLLGGFALARAGEISFPAHSCERVLALLALSDRPVPRAFVAATLWPDTTDLKASANLRTALWRLHVAGADIVDGGCSSHLALRSDVWVDVHYVRAAARSYRAHRAVPGGDFIDRAHGDLLPGFWDSWLVFERERLRQELIHLYEVICADALVRGDAHLAVVAALAAVECDPLRASSTQWLIRSHLAQGNAADAHAAYRRYEALLADELGARPSAELSLLLSTALRAQSNEPDHSVGLLLSAPG